MLEELVQVKHQQ